MSLSYFLAKRFFKNPSTGVEGGRGASRSAILIATAGIAIGVAVMLVSVSIVKGYQDGIRNNFSGFASHLEVLDINTFNSPESFPITASSELEQKIKRVPSVTRVQRYGQKIGIIKTADDFAGVVVKGVGQDYDLSFMQNCVVAGKIPTLCDDRASGSIVISRTLAQKLKLKVGDSVYSYFFSETIKQRKFKVAAIYDTHLKQFDRAFILTDLYTVQKLNDWADNQVSGYEIKLKNFEDIADAEIKIAALLRSTKTIYGKSYSVVSIRETPRTASVFPWVDALDMNVKVILIIMIVVAGFTVISGLLILILERTTTIGLLKSLGMTGVRIRRTFLWYAAFIIGRGLLVGNIVGLGLVALQHYFKLIPLDPEHYYFDIVPTAFSLWWVIGINVATLVITLLALILPSFLVSSIQPAKAIQFD